MENFLPNGNKNCKIGFEFELAATTDIPQRVFIFVHMELSLIEFDSFSVSLVFSKLLLLFISFWRKCYFSLMFM